MTIETTVGVLPSTGAHTGTEQGGFAEVIDLEAARDARNLTTFHGLVDVEGAAKPVKWTAAVPDELQEDSWGLIVPGLGAFKRTSREFRNSLARHEGIMAVSYDPAREDEQFTWDTFWQPQQLHVNTIDAVVNAVRAHENLGDLASGPALSEAPVTLIAHSMGGLSATEWALRHPDDTSMLLYLGAAGLNKASALRLIARTPKILLGDIVPGIVRGEYGHSPVLAKRSLDYFTSNKKRTAAEILSCFLSDKRPELHALGSLGVKRVVACMEADVFFKPDETFDAVAHLVDDTTTIEGPHTAPQRRARQAAAAVAAIIREMA